MTPEQRKAMRESIENNLREKFSDEEHPDIIQRETEIEYMVNHIESEVSRAISEERDLILKIVYGSVVDVDEKLQLVLDHTEYYDILGDSRLDDHVELRMTDNLLEDQPSGIGETRTTKRAAKVSHGYTMRNLSSRKTLGEMLSEDSKRRLRETIVRINSEF